MRPDNTGKFRENETSHKEAAVIKKYSKDNENCAGIFWKIIQRLNGSFHHSVFLRQE